MFQKVRQPVGFITAAHYYLFEEEPAETEYCEYLPGFANPTLMSMAEKLSLQPEQFGMKLGMIIGMLFPLIAIAVYATYLKSYRKKN